MLKKIIKYTCAYKYSLTYIVLVLLLNTLFSLVPLTKIMGAEVSPMDWTVGVVYVLRDFAQRELQHKVIIAMLIGCILSYFLADKALAIASVSAFLTAEFFDWAVYTFTRRPLSQRILWSATLSSPIDSSVFLAIIHQFNYLGVIILSLAKISGVFIVWYCWKIRHAGNNTERIQMPEMKLLRHKKLSTP
jgi:queuosine precursor transporter